MSDLVSVPVESHQIGGSPGFGFTAVGLDHLGASEYTLASVAVDLTGSTLGFEDDLRAMLVASINACQLNPMSENLMARALGFSTRYQNGITEFHGFVPLANIDTAQYPRFQPDGATPLADACFSSVGALADYGATLTGQEYLTNGIVFVITDGADNYSTHTAADVKARLQRVRREEQLESLMTILIGINARQYQQELDEFFREAGFDQYIDAGDVSPKSLAKLASFVSESISSTSQSLGTGGPSQTISATI